MDCREGAGTAILQLGRVRKINLQIFEVSVVLGCWCMGLWKSIFLDHFLEGCPCPGLKGLPAKSSGDFAMLTKRGREFTCWGPCESYSLSL